MKSIRFALRSLLRDMKAGELTVLLAAVIVAVASMTAVGFFTDRVANAVRAQAAVTLAADMVIRSPSPIDDAFIDEARALGLRTSKVFGFPTAVMADDQSSLAVVSAVSEGYPLRGEVLVAEEMFGATAVPDGIPVRGEAWAGPGLLARLDIEVGEILKVGSARLRISRVLEYRPDQELGFLSLAPSLLVNLDDVPAMDVSGAGSRVTYRQLFAGDQDALAEFRARIWPRLGSGQQLRDVDAAGDQIGAAIDRAQRFLTLASLVTVILAAIATAMAARRYALRHLDTVALLKSIGAPQVFVQQTMLAQLSIITLGTAAVGTILGYIAQYVLAYILADFFNFELPAASMRSGLLGLATAATVAIGFAMPHLLQLKTTPPIRVLRHDLPPPKLQHGVVYGIALAALLGMIWAIVRDLRLLTFIVGGLVGMAAAAGTAGWLLVRLLTRFRGAGGIAWRYGLANVARRGRESVVQVVAFGLGLMVLLLLTVVRNDLLKEWRATLPEDTPNYFLINIQPEEWPGISTLFREELGVEPEFAPLIRGRLASINGMPIEDIEFPSPQGKRFVAREANLTWRGGLPDTNEIRAGEWWGEDYSGALQLSLEQGLARSLGVALGDEISLNVGGEEFIAPVTSLRFVEWDSLSPNFYLMLSPGDVVELPQTYLTSVYVPDERRAVLKTLLQRFPGVTLFDLEVILAQVRTVIDRASLAVQYVFLFTVLAGVVVLLAAVQVTRDERRFESAILHTLGARRGMILQGIATEFLALGALAGLLAAIGATVVGYVLAERVFELPYRLDPLLWILGLLLGGLIVGATGTLATRKAVNEPPVRVLRNG